MAKIIAITNQKGGVGKTTTSINLSASLAATKRRVLLVDLDPQGNATMGSGVDKSALEASSCELLLGESPIQEVIVKTEHAGYNLIPANADVTAAEVGLMDMPGRELQLKKALAEVEQDYDFILIDCPPSLNMLTVNALVAAGSVIIPMQCEYYALEGLTALLGTIDQIRVASNPELHIEGLLRTMFDARNNLANDVSDQLTSFFGDKLYRTVVPRNIRLAEAPSHGLPVIIYDKACAGTVAYLALAGEILRKEQQVEVPQGKVQAI